MIILSTKVRTILWPGDEKKESGLYVIAMHIYELYLSPRNSLFWYNNTTIVITIL